MKLLLVEDGCLVNYTDISLLFCVCISLLAGAVEDCEFISKTWLAVLYRKRSTMLYRKNVLEIHNLSKHTTNLRYQHFTCSHINH